MAAHDNPASDKEAVMPESHRYVNLDDALEAVKQMRDPVEPVLGAERAGYVAATGDVLQVLVKLPTVKAKP